MNSLSQIIGWGRTDEHGSEIWDAEPVFRRDRVGAREKLKLFFYPKKFFLYGYLQKHRKHKNTENTLLQPFRILDVGCGTGAAVIDLKKLFGRQVEVVGIDVVKLQVELAEKKMRRYGVWAKIEWYDGTRIPYPADYFDAIYTSDVLGHVQNVPVWLDELQRVLKPGGALAMFSESRPGPHAYIRNYLYQRGLNADPLAEFHISLYSKKKLHALIEKAGFSIEKMRGVFWASFLVHPDEFYQALSQTRQFPFLRTLNALLYYAKKITHPVSTALTELYGLIEILLIGRWVEAQGYIILARKRE